MTDAHKRGIRDYGIELLMRIANDLAKNPDSRRDGSWEQGRLQAIRQELRTRLRKDKQA
jgi:hypothetical protein